MTLLQYILFANLYILAFWLGYRVWLKNLIYFTSIRVYLNASIVLSLILPFLQSGIADMIASNDIVSISQDVPVVGIIYKYQIGQPFDTASVDSFNWSRMIEAILLSGCVATALIYLFNHLRIKSIIGRSSRYLQVDHGLWVMKSDEICIPFIYFNHIVVPGKITDKDLPRVIQHELMHYLKGHYFDNLLFSVIHVVFWANPFFLLLRNAQKLNHEFQVDDQIISNGEDPVSYKLSLIKYSVGHHLYSLANGLSNTNTKTRLMMMNHIHIRKGKWRLLLLLPTITILFTVFCCTNMEPNNPEIQSEAPADISQDDSLVVEFINVYQGSERLDVTWARNSVIVVLMNRRSQIMVAGEVLPLADVERRVISLYNRKIEEKEDTNAGQYPENTNFGIKIVVQKDRASNMDDYQKLIDNISTALFKLREMQSIRLFGGNFETLSDSEREVIENLIPLRIYGVKPDKHMGQ